jgi:hypothetical protein
MNETQHPMAVGDFQELKDSSGEIRHADLCATVVTPEQKM